MFYDNLCKFCAERNIKLATLAADLGFSRGTPAAWKRGNAPQDVTLAKIAAYFGVTKEELIYGKSDTAQSTPQTPASLDTEHRLLALCESQQRMLASQQETIRLLSGKIP